MRMTIPSYIQTALDTLTAAGFEAYPVGGCVRDALLGMEPEDYDITTSALPAQIKALFETDYKLIESGMRHGTVAPIIEKHAVEITTYRVDGDYSDHRHPDSVHFSDRLEDDLSRRDFTVNAMAYSSQRGVIDYFGGTQDLANHCIRCVGAPDRRFAEDALRMLRALRFAAVLGFSVEEETAGSITENFGSILAVSAERIYGELKKLLAGKDSAAVLRRFPCVTQTLFSLSLTEAQLQALEAPHTAAFAFAVIFINRDTAALKDYKPDNQTLHFAQTMQRLYHAELGDAQKSPGALYVWMREQEIDAETMQIYLTLCERLESEFCAADYRMALAQAQQQNLPLTAADLALGGEDLREMGYRGREIGATIRQLIGAVLNGEAQNEKKALISYLRKK